MANPLTQPVQVGGTGDFHLRRIGLLASRVEKAIRSFLAGERVSGEDQTPNRAVKASGITSTRTTLDGVQIISDQNVVGEEQLQNM